MGLPVVTVVSGGLPIVESTVGGTPVTEAANGRGLPVTKVVGKPGLPVVFETIGVGAPVTYAALNGTPSHTTLSNGNLTATHADTFGNAGARSASVKTMGKYYFEAVYGAIPDNGDGIGIIQATLVRRAYRQRIGAREDIIWVVNQAIQRVVDVGYVAREGDCSGAIPRQPA